MPWHARHVPYNSKLKQPESKGQSKGILLKKQKVAHAHCHHAVQQKSRNCSQASRLLPPLMVFLLTEINLP